MKYQSRSLCRVIRIHLVQLNPDTATPGEFFTEVTTSILNPIWCFVFLRSSLPMEVHAEGAAKLCYVLCHRESMLLEVRSSIFSFIINSSWTNNNPTWLLFSFICIWLSWALDLSEVLISFRRRYSFLGHWWLYSLPQSRRIGSLIFRQKQ